MTQAPENAGATDESTTTDEGSAPAEDEAPEPYVEDPNFVPNPQYQTNVVDTSGVSGGHADINAVSPIFAQHRADSLRIAAEEFKDGDYSHVGFDDAATLDREQAQERLDRAVANAEKDPRVLTPEDKDEAAEEGKDVSPEDEQADRQYEEVGAASSSDNASPATTDDVDHDSIASTSDSEVQSGQSTPAGDAAGRTPEQDASSTDESASTA